MPQSSRVSVVLFSQAPSIQDPVELPEKEPSVADAKCYIHD